MQHLVSILIPVHNAEASLAASIQSCLDQTYPHIEILVLDDASTDGSLAIAESFDSLKISIFRNSGREGIAHSRNTLLKHARGEYIAWLDADDTMHKDRIDQQVAFMEAHPGTDIAGSWIYTDHTQPREKKFPLLHAQIKTMLWFRNCMAQPSVISKNFYKKEDIWYDTGYNNSAEDYELWYRLATKKKFANIPAFLTTYHTTTGKELSDKQTKTHFKEHINKLWKKKWQDMHIPVDAKDKQLFQDFLYENRPLDKKDTRSILKTLYALKQYNPDPFFRLIIAFHLLRSWKNMGFMPKLLHLDILSWGIYYFKMKRNYLF